MSVAMRSVGGAISMVMLVGAAALGSGGALAAATGGTTDEGDRLAFSQPGEGAIGAWREIGRLPYRVGDDWVELVELTAIGDRLLLHARMCPVDESRCRDTIWQSDDPATWSASELPGEQPVIGDMARTADGVVAVGGIGSRQDRAAAVWITSDGVDWELASAPPVRKLGRVVRPESPLIVNSGSGMWSLRDGAEWQALGTAPAARAVAGPAGLLSAGGGGQDLVTPTVLWHSADGRAWSRVRLPRQLRGGHPAFGEIQVLSLGGKWVLVPAQKVPRSIFVSKDGQYWRRIPRPLGMTAGYVWWMERVGDDVQAHGSDGRGRPTVWTWRLGEPAPAPERIQGKEIGPPVRWRDGFVAIGSVTSGNEADLVLWRWAGEADALDPAS